MNFELKEPVLVIGLGGLGSKLAVKAKESLQQGAAVAATIDCLLISNDQDDLKNEKSIKLDTNSIINPSSQTIRGFALESSDKIKDQIAQYSSVIMMANLAGKSGSAIAPIVSSICKKESKNLISFAVMPFEYENDRIFASGVSLKRVKADSTCTIILDNDAMLQSNPDLSVKTCYNIANSAIMHMVESLKSDQVPSETNVLSTSSKDTQDIEVSLRDSLKMLYENAPPNSVKSSIIHVLGGDNVPVGMIKAMTSLTQGVTGQVTSTKTSSSRNTSSLTVESEKEKAVNTVIMLSTVQGQTKFDKYDPLGDIPMENTLDWESPDCSYDCKLDMYQLE